MMSPTQARWRRGLATLLVLVLLACSTLAGAEETAVAVWVEGPDAGAVRAVIDDALPAGTKLVGEVQLRAELHRQGQRGFGTEIDGAAMARIRKAARVLGVGAVVVARVRRDRAGRRVLLLVVDAWRVPAAVAEARVELKAHTEDVDAVKEALGPSLSSNAPADSTRPQAGPAAPEQVAPPPAEVPAAPPAEAPPVVPRATEAVPQTGMTYSSPATSPAESPASVRPPTPGQRMATAALDLSVGDEVAGRRFEYDNGIAPRTRVWSAFPSPGLSVRATVFPFALRDVGLSAEYLRIFSAANTGGSLTADMAPSSYAIGARVRVHPGRDPPALLGLSLAYACTTFTSVGTPDAELPDVTYRSVRPSIDVRIPIGVFSVTASAAFHAIVDPGGTSTRFYGPSGYGLASELGGTLLFGSKIELRLSGWYERYSFQFSPPPGARFEHGGALDQLYGARLALALLL
jgi:hypothetical protein